MDKSAIIVAIIGAVATIAAAIIAIQSPAPSPQPLPPVTVPTSVPAPVFSLVSGSVFDKDTHQPLAEMDITAFMNNGAGDYPEIARTAPDGSFEADFSRYNRSYFPIRIVVIGRPGWKANIFESNIYLHYGETLRNVNIYYPVMK